MGMIDKNGDQWEHCNHCGAQVQLSTLKTGYSYKWPDHKFVDLCTTCYEKLFQDYPKAINGVGMDYRYDKHPAALEFTKWVQTPHYTKRCKSDVAYLKSCSYRAIGYDPYNYKGVGA